ncbi:MAG: hypothetical protein LBK04_07140 [Clostridiales Family XIII bacterium]|jgi:hypothetical protein|nr:hypothetical protein [Clostridiales Family XIII bacterium]
MHDDKTQKGNAQAESIENQARDLQSNGIWLEPTEESTRGPRSGDMWAESTEEPERETRSRRTKTKRPAGRQISLKWALAAIGVVLAIAAAAIFIVLNYNSNVDEGPNADMLAKLGGIMILPEGEEPVVSTVTDAAGLKDGAPFYRNAENGDKILIYAESGKIIIYREGENLIVNAGPIIDG